MEIAILTDFYQYKLGIWISKIVIVIVLVIKLKYKNIHKRIKILLQ